MGGAKRGQVASGIPSRPEALAILKAVGCPPEVIKHSERVARVALRIAEACRRAGLEVDMGLVEAGALLHDMGRAKTHSVAHAFLGAELARELGLGERLVRLIARHTGGVRPEVAERLGWPRGDYGPETLEEKIVAYADKLVRGPRVLPFEEALVRLERELGPDHPAVVNLAKVHAELAPLLRPGGGGRGPCGRAREGVRAL